MCELLSVSVCVTVCVPTCVCVSLASDFSETIEGIIIKLDTVTASDMRMHHVLTILTLILMEGHTDRNHGNNKCLILSETIQAISLL